MKPSRRLVRWGWLALMAMVVFLANDSAAQANQVGKASGRILVSGKPLAAGKITLYRGDGQFAGCKIKEGHFKIDVIPSGEFTVVIEGATVPPKYGHEDKSPLRIQIKEGANQFDLDVQ